MFRHFLLTTQRHLRKDWPYTLINVVGLTIGLSLVFFIILFVNREFSWNKMHENRDDVYRVLIHNGILDWNQPMAPYSYGPGIKEDLPDIRSYTRLSGARGTLSFDEQEGIFMYLYGADPGIFDIFTFNYLKGPGGSQLLKSKDEIVLSKKYADIVFGDADPIGKTVTLDGQAGKLNLVVTGVYDNFEETSTFRPAALISAEWLPAFFNSLGVEDNPRLCFFQTYLRLKEGTDLKSFKERLTRLEEKYFEPDWEYSVDLQNLGDIYLQSQDLVNPRTRMGDPKKIRVFSLVGVLVLLIGAFNYIILASARTANRYREIGLRKVNGASRQNISLQIYGESILTSLLAFPLSLLLVALLIPKANQILGTSLAFEPGVHPWLIPGFFLLCILVGVLSGAYLALYLSRLRPVDILRSRKGLSSSRSGLYKILVTAQILIFVGMLSCSVLIFKQVRYAEKLDQGFDRENLFIIPINMRQFPRYDALAAELRNLSGVVSAGVAMGGPPSDGMGVYQVPHRGDPDQTVSVEGLSVGGHYPQTMRFELIAGRWFTPEAEGDERSVIVNETAIREVGITGDPIGQEFGSNTIIGVIRDFFVHSIRLGIAPMAISMSTQYCYEVAVRVRPADQENTLKQIEQVYKRVGGPDVYFEIVSFDDALANMYNEERNFAKTLTGFTGLAIFIAVLGLFGLSLLLASKRTKEIGIRKVHGAPVLSVIKSINKGFVYFTFFAWLLSIPLTIWIMRSWLQNFVYRTEIGFVEFVGAGIVALIVVVLTVSYHAWRAARMNPADAIRDL